LPTFIATHRCQSSHNDLVGGLTPRSPDLQKQVTSAGLHLHGRGVSHTGSIPQVDRRWNGADQPLEKSGGSNGGAESSPGSDFWIAIPKAAYPVELQIAGIKCALPDLSPSRHPSRAYAQVKASRLDRDNRLCEYHTHGPHNAWTACSPSSH
jgi:hypothetical protein